MFEMIMDVFHPKAVPARAQALVPFDCVDKAILEFAQLPVFVVEL